MRHSERLQEHFTFRKCHWSNLEIVSCSDGVIRIVLASAYIVKFFLLVFSLTFLNVRSSGWMLWLCGVDFCICGDIGILFYSSIDGYTFSQLRRLSFLPCTFLLTFQNHVTLFAEIDVFVFCFFLLDYMKIFNIRSCVLMSMAL